MACEVYRAKGDLGDRRVSIEYYIKSSGGYCTWRQRDCDESDGSKNVQDVLGEDQLRERCYYVALK
jgi:hypothetical protein